MSSVDTGFVFFCNNSKVIFVELKFKSFLKFILTVLGHGVTVCTRFKNRSVFARFVLSSALGCLEEVSEQFNSNA